MIELDNFKRGEQKWVYIITEFPEEYTSADTER